MDHNIPNTTKTIQLFLLYAFLSNLFHLNSADPPYHTTCRNNTTSNSTTHTQFRSNLNTLLSSLLTTPSFSKQNNTSFGKFPDTKVYVQYMCLNYETNATCKACVESASELIEPLCPNDDDSTVWEENCQLRYSNNNFLGQLDVSGNQACWNAKNISDPEEFRHVLNETVSGLAKQAAFNVSAGMYATGGADLDIIDSGNRIFALVQCTTDLTAGDCFTCLMVALANVSSCCYFSRGARVLGRSCYLRYELYKFYGIASESDVPPSATNKAAWKRQTWRTIIIVAAIALLVVALSILGVSFCCLLRRKKMKRRNRGNANQEVQSQSQDIRSQSKIGLLHLDIPGREGLNSRESGFIDLTSILKATNNFSDSNLLGRGGFGPVYKGILADGQEVAVKRLSSCSEQGNEEFTNEVLLIMKLQHKNLVRLLGYCIDGEEKLLVYEFMPNGSLDVILFDPTRRPELSWSRRISILNGVAKGMLYLHEDSRLRIVHRDLKASNVLLDINMNPKISDFGMARIFGGNESDSSSTARIVGTYGYMAPEYAMEGLYSTKSDVFSFGVLLIEIITGRRNMGFHRTKLAANLIAYAWQLCKEGKEEELMDPLVKESCSSDEFSWFMRIGLLCVLGDANDRPTMSSIVLMLKSDKETTSLPLPQHSTFNLGRFMDQLEANSGQQKEVDLGGETF